MKMTNQLIEGRFLKRYKRFFADIELSSGEVVTAHVPNTGKMTSCIGKNWKSMISHHPSPHRKLSYTLEMTHNGSSWIMVNTHLANKIVKSFLTHFQIPGLENYQLEKPEIKIGNSRIDFLLKSKSSESNFFLEVKNATLNELGISFFPDTKSDRALKHVHELVKVIETNKGQAGILFLIPRGDTSSFSPSYHLDPVYAQTLENASKKGLQIIPLQCKVTPESIEVHRVLPVNWSVNENNILC